MKKDIYIIKNSINDKVYIGQAKNAAERWLSHIYNASYEARCNKEIQVIHKAMAKYGYENFHYEILEHQIENYDEREQYWIAHYNSRVPNGYNVVVGGASVGAGIDSPHAVFKTEDELLRCISEISSSKKSFANIASKYGCSCEVISAINSGKRYRKDFLTYPLRDTNTKYGAELLRQIRYSLKYERDLTMMAISRKYNIDPSQLSEINQGKIYYVFGETYPLREKRTRGLSKEQIDEIVNDILHSELCLADIAAKHNISRASVTGINRGTYHRSSMLTYPLRKDGDARNRSLKKFLDRDEIVEICEQLKKGVSAKEIAEKYSVSTTTIYNINAGKCKKYFLDGMSYPIKAK